MDWYSPDEDSYTLLDCITEENIQNSVILDLGTSTGYITKNLHNSNLVISSDLNYKALLQQKSCNNLMYMNLLSCINQGRLDCIIFNPPYVPYSDCPIIGGGLDGRDVINKFIEEVEVKLFYLLIIEANKPKEVIKDIEKKGYKVEVKKVRKILWETIIILKCVKC